MADEKNIAEELENEALDGEVEMEEVEIVTLTDEETVRAMNKVIKRLEAIGAAVRQ